MSVPVPPRRVTWTPRLSVVGVAGGVLTVVGVVVLLQQSGAVYPTQFVAISALLGGVAVGVGVPSLSRWVAVQRLNQRLTLGADPASGLAFAPTHVVPSGGMPAFGDHDTSLPPAAHLEAGLEVRADEWWGDWAFVRCSNGWGAWVDGRVLVNRFSRP